MKCELSDICVYRNERISTNALNSHTYVSTENMLPDKGGITDAASLPTVFQTSKFRYGDTLVSNIRPYFKKIWFAEYDGGCSNDVLVFSAKEGVDPKYLYYVLANDSFFAYSTATSKGTKMPRGDKTSIMQYQIEKVDSPTQKKIAAILSALDEKIAINRAINDNLEQQAQAIFKSWFVNFEPFNGTMPYNWTICALGDITEMGAGGDKPKEASPVKTLSHQYPIYSNGINNYGLYGYANEPKIKDESVTVSARGTIGYVCLRHHPYVPIVRLVTLIPDVNVVSAKYLYLYLRQLHIAGTGTTQQQLTVPDFRKTEIVIPDKTTMGAFTEAVTPIFEQIWANEDENIKLAEIRDALLPKLMSGELDVSAVEF